MHMFSKVAQNNPVVIQRGNTAIRRSNCSRPIAIGLADGLINRQKQVFDYGCGHGEDIRYLKSQGVKASGWDPFHLPKGKPKISDVVNIGYVLNVIEDPVERAETLLNAYTLCKEVLIVAVRVDQMIGDIAEFGDGFLTTKNTFQKIYNQAELRNYIEDTLQTRAHTAALGIAYVFQNAEAEARYVASQAFRRRLEYRTDIIDLFSSDTIAKRFVRQANKIGRVPLPEEFRDYPTLLDRFGSPQRIVRLALRLIDQKAFEGSRSQRKEDILTYLAMIRLQALKVPPLRSLTPDIQADIKGLWGDFHSALAEADEFLFSIGQPERVKTAAESVALGKLVFDDLYIHRSAEDDLPPLLRLVAFAGRQIVGDTDYNIVKISIDGRKVSFLRYENFDEDPHPALRYGVRVFLPRASYQIRDYRDSENPPILHRKDTLVSLNYPYHDRFRKLTVDEEAHGLLSQTGIGYKKEWERKLTDRGLAIHEHSIQSQQSFSG
jgi:DNA phosphorothioation-associated putative methyltransferase